MTLSLLDTNVLIHAAYQISPLHAEARKVLDRALGEQGKYCLSPQNLVEFCAVVTRKRLVEQALSAEEAFCFVNVLYRSRNLKKIYPKRGTVQRAAREGSALGLSGPVWYDLYLALTMRDAGVQAIVTEDVAHFQRFPFVSTLTIAEAARR